MMVIRQDCMQCVSVTWVDILHGTRLTLFTTCICHTQVKVPSAAHFGLQHDLLLDIKYRNMSAIKRETGFGGLVRKFVE